MDRSVIDLYEPGFWCFLAIAVLVLAPITAPVLRKWVWAGFNLAFLGMVLGVPNVERAGELVQRGGFRDAAAFLGSSALGMTCIGVLTAWLVLQAVGWRRIGVLPLVVGGLAVMGL